MKGKPNPGGLLYFFKPISPLFLPPDVSEKETEFDIFSSPIRVRFHVYT